MVHLKPLSSSGPRPTAAARPGHPPQFVKAFGLQVGRGHNCSRVLGVRLTTSANPTRERRKDQGEEEEKKKGAKPSLPPSFEQWEARAWATERTPALAVNCASMHTRHRAAAPSRRAPHCFLVRLVACASAHEHASVEERGALISHIACGITVVVIYLPACRRYDNGQVVRRIAWRITLPTSTVNSKIEYEY